MLPVPISLVTYHLSHALVSQIMVKLLQGILCLISCNYRHHLTNHGFSSIQKIIVLEEGMIITLYSLKIAQTLWRTTSWGRGLLVLVFLKQYAC